MKEPVECVGGPMDGHVVWIEPSTERVGFPVEQPRRVTHFDDPAGWHPVLGFPHRAPPVFGRFLYRRQGDVLVPA